MTNIDGSSHARAAHSSDDVRANSTETCANLTHLPHLPHLTEKNSSGYEDHPTSSTSTPERATVDGSNEIDQIRHNLALAEHELAGIPYTPPEAVIGWLKPLASMARRLLEEVDACAAASSTPVDAPGSLRPVEEIRADLANAAVAPLWDTGRDVIGTGPVVRLLRDVPALLAEVEHGVTLRRLQAISVARCARWHGPDTEPWSGADWSNATSGEIGEVAEVFAQLVAAGGKAGNVVKKLRRHETRTGSAANPPVDELVAALAEELADVACYLPLLAAHYGIDLEAAVVAKFDAVSVREGFPERLG